MLNTDPSSRASQSPKSASFLNSFREKLFTPKKTVLEIDLDSSVCEEFSQKEEGPKSDSNFSSHTFRKRNELTASSTLFLRLESLTQKLKRQTTETERLVRMDLRLETRNLKEKDSRGTIVKKFHKKIARTLRSNSVRIRRCSQIKKSVKRSEEKPKRRTSERKTEETIVLVTKEGWKKDLRYGRRRHFWTDWNCCEAEFVCRITCQRAKD
ncbi:hypothetical protein V6Z15_07305 [Leptospira borgpetersenii]|nr:hypothetical protein [Leptospira borgpetersenii]